ncbi:MAG: hypothetical protein FJW34_00150 [Acidobacteria bacterium]|nr:hypothetical protein [Acidobacteriota bacterium]
MPIRRDLRRFYGAEWRTVIRPRILARARNRCERCGVPDRIETIRAGSAWFEAHYSRWFDHRRRVASPLARAVRTVRVVLTVAHLNHDPADNRDENLAALCQWCHLHYDAPHHKETRATRKDARRPLLRGLAQASA